NPDALQRLIELAPLALAEPEIADAFADAAAEVARTAPEELLIAMKGAAPGPQDAALTAVARGLVRAHDKDHPFPGVVKAALVHPDADVAAFAKAFAPRLDERLQIVESAMKAPVMGPVSPLPSGPGELRKGGG